MRKTVAKQIRQACLTVTGGSVAVNTTLARKLKKEYTRLSGERRRRFLASLATAGITTTRRGTYE